MDSYNASKMKDDEHLVLDVSGHCFNIRQEFINQFPDALVARIWQYFKNPQKIDLPKHVYQNRVEPNRFFVQRSPVVFGIILQCYTTGKLHVPEWMCKESLMDEVHFWKLQSQLGCPCCTDTEEPPEPEKHRKEPIKKDKGSTEWERKKQTMWTFFQKPNSSRAATIFASLEIAMIIVSTVCYVFETVPEFIYCSNNNTDNNPHFVVVGSLFGDLTVKNITANVIIFNDTKLDNQTAEIINSRYYKFFSNCLSQQVFKAIESLCALWFTVELTTRFVVCPNKLVFAMSPLNVIDLLACFNIYVEILLIIVNIDRTGLNDAFVKFIVVLKCSTVLRILKFIRYFEDLRLLVKTFKSAKKELGMLCVFILVTVLIYSCLLFEIEKDWGHLSLYNSVPTSAWWSIVTLTTVGFGDAVPMSPMGKIIGGFACVTGIIIIALPVSVLVEHFTKAYKKKKAAELKAMIKARSQSRASVQFD